MKIPKSFKLFGSTINIKWENKDLNKMGVLGETHFASSLINLSDTNGLDKLSEDTIADTFYHEKVHIILDHMGEHSLSENEKFVDVFAKLLRQSDETAQY
jgi:hypothetical protein